MKGTVNMNVTKAHTAFYSSCVIIFAVMSGPRAIAAVVDFQLSTLSAPSALNTAGSVPASQTAFALGASIYLEVWAQTTHPNGLSSASLDISFDSPRVSAATVTHSPMFSTLTHSSIDNGAGWIDDLSGSHLGPCTDVVGVAPNWVRVAVVEFIPNENGPVTFQSISTGSPIYGSAICAVGDVDPAQIAYGSAAVQIGDAPIPAISFWGACVLALGMTIAATLVVRARCDLRYPDMG